MKKRLCTALFTAFFFHCAFGQIVINEFMYNPPESGQDSLEYIELFNTSDISVDLTNYSLTTAVTFTFPGFMLPAGEYVIIAVNKPAFENVFGTAVTVFQWDDSQALNNTGEDIILLDQNSSEVDRVSYEDDGAWPIEADGGGYALELCDPFVDNTVPNNWLISENNTGITINAATVFASPGSANSVTCPDPPDAPEVAITEIMYNDPGSTDVIEFIELFNYGNLDVDLNGWDLGDAVTYEFPAMTLESGAYVVVCNNAQAFMDRFGFAAIEWTADGLNNAGETIQLRDAADEVIDEVSYSDVAPWPLEADGLGASIVLCDARLDNNDAANWRAATTAAGFDIEGQAISANPMAASYCALDVAEVTQVDENGVATSDGWSAQLQGIVYGVNLRPNGLQFTIIDGAGDGIALFESSGNFGYTVQEGDEVVVRGVVEQFNGLTQMELDTVGLIGSGNPLVNAMVVTALNEDTESQLVSLENVELVNPSQWINAGSGFNVDVTNGSETFTIRIDADVNIYDMPYPTGTFTVTGIGGQFDSATPFDAGYQLLLRYVADIDPYTPFVEQYPQYEIGTVTTVDGAGLADSIDVTCELSGIAYGINLRPNGLQFTIIDGSNNGIAVFSEDRNFDYEVREGDEVVVQGIIDQFAGLIQIEPDTVWLNSSGNNLFDPTVVTTLGEDTESQFVKLEGLTFSDATEWLGDGSTFNVTATDGTTNFTIRIDNDTDMANMSIPPEPFNLTGIGGQFDTQDPLTDGYQIFPRFRSDFESTNTTNDLAELGEIVITPNPVRGILEIQTALSIDRIVVHDVHGKRWIQSVSETEIDMYSLPSGLYLVTLTQGDRSYTARIVKL